MKEETKEFIIGYDTEKKAIATMKVKVKHPCYYNKEKGSYTDFEKFEFTSSFNIGTLTDIDEENENAKEYYEMVFDDCYDAERKLDLLCNGERTKNDVIDEWMRYEYDYRERIDCSCTDYEFIFDNITYNFRTDGCGQHDIREDSYNWQHVNEKVGELLKFWDEYHLKELTEESYDELMELLQHFESFQDDDVIIDIAKKNFFEEVQKNDK